MILDPKRVAILIPIVVMLSITPGPTLLYVIFPDPERGSPASNYRITEF